MSSKEFSPMLASVFDPDKLTFPKLASRKLDGIRCLVRGGVAVSRNEKPIRNRFIQSIIGDPSLNGLDGELMVGKPNDDKAFRNATSGVMSEDGEPDFKFFVFDSFHPTHGFEYRLESAQRAVEKFGDKRVQVIEHKLIKSLKDLDRLEAKWLSEGYEGVMLRSLNGPYKFGRSTVTEGHLLKVKRFSDAEAVIIDYVEEVTSKDRTPKGTLGKFICRTPEGIEFGVGGGFTAEERKVFWKNRKAMIGKLVKYKHFTIGVKDAPRFPSFLGIRDENDLS